MLIDSDHEAESRGEAVRADHEPVAWDITILTREDLNLSNCNYR
jgi:hypothetical protein